MELKEAQEFARILKQAYQGELEAVPINPYFKKEFLTHKIPEGKDGKQLSQYFPFTLKTAMKGIPKPPLPPGHADPVIIC